MHCIVWVGLVSAIFVAPSDVQQSQVVTEAEFLSALDDDSHPAIIERAAALATARAHVVIASALDNPVLAVGREALGGAERETDVTVSWQLPGRDRRPRIAAREEAAAAAAAHLDTEVLALRSTLREVYARWALAEARREQIAGHAQRVEALAAREHLRAQGGEGSVLEAHRLDLAATRLRARLALVAVDVETAKGQAKVWLPTLSDRARPELPYLPPVPQRFPDHPRVLAAERDLAAANWLREAAARFIRSPEILLGWQRDEVGSLSSDGPIIGLSWSVPVASRNRGARAASEARVSAATARLTRIQREVAASREATRRSYDHLRAAFAQAESAQGRNQRMIQGAEARFRHGESSLTDLLEIQRSVTESELAVLDLQEAALAMHREFERVTGQAILGADSAEADLDLDPQTDLNPHSQENSP